MASDFQTTDTANLDKHVKYGTYYGRVKVGGKLIRQSFGGNKRVAVEKLVPWLIGQRGAKRTAQGTLNSLTEKYIVWLKSQERNGDLNEETTMYKRECVNAIRKVWPAFSSTEVTKLTAGDLEEFRNTFRDKYSSSRTNGSITVLRELFQLAKRHEMISIVQLQELTDGWKFTKVKNNYEEMTRSLPSQSELSVFRSALHARCAAKFSDGGELFDFLMYSGSRIEAAISVTWQDVDWEGNNLFFGNAKFCGYSIPLFPELREFLLKLREKKKDAKDTDKILATKSLHTVFKSLSQELRPDKKRFTHHTLRHLFATRCIEAGKDLLTVSRWMGHKDAGRTVMLVYGHLRDKHSQESAGDMRFLPESKLI